LKSQKTEFLSPDSRADRTGGRRCRDANDPIFGNSGNAQNRAETSGEVGLSLPIPNGREPMKTSMAALSEWKADTAKHLSLALQSRSGSDAFSRSITRNKDRITFSEKNDLCDRVFTKIRFLLISGSPNILHPTLNAFLTD
jgi:hypothetical protein